MEPPDYDHDDFDDEDAMINDYIEGDGIDEPPASPPPYEDDTEWMAVGRDTATGAGAAVTTAAATSPAASDILNNDDPFDMEEGRAMAMVVGDREDMFSDDEYHHERPASTVHLNFARKRRKQKDPYAFERYKGENSDNTWRADKTNSPSTMRAKSWKTTNVRNPLSSLLLQRRKEVAPNAPDAQLLSFLRGTPIPLKPKIRMPGNPVPGKACISLTLGDGTRLYCPIQQPDDASQLSRASQQSFDSPLGVSIAVLLQRVQSARRQREHSKLQLLRPSTSNHDDLEEEDLPRSISNSSARIGTSGHHHQLWVDKHAPHSFAHLLSDERANREVVRALREWDPYVFHRDPPKRPEAYAAQQAKNSESQESKHNNNNGANKTSKNPKDKRPAESHRVILLSGSPGVGKTTLAHIVARHVGYRPVEVNGSDERSESALTERVIRAMESTTLQFGKDSNKPNCLILDEIDGADAARSIQALVNIIRAEMPTSKGASSKHSKPYLRRPIIFICNNKFAPALKPLLPYARQFTVHPPSTTRLVARLRSILADERLSCGSAALLNQLVEASGGDIRSCLHTLQFASAKSRRDRRSTSALTDIAHALEGALGGDSLKDERNDVVGTLTTIFRKEKEGKLPGSRIQKVGVRTTEKVLDAVHSFGDSSKILDCLFLNTLRVSYVDPTLDRCAAAHEWMSSSDIYRSNRMTNQFAMEALHIPAATGAIHLLCRVEQRQDLTYSTRELVDAHFLHESNIGLAQKFFEGLSLQTRGARGVPQLASEIVPYALWMLSAGEGSSALDRVATSVDLLSKGEQNAFRQHAATLRVLGLSYVKEQEESVDAHKNFRHMPMKVRLEPPIEQFVKFSDLQVPRREIPAALKQLLSRQAAHDRMSGSRNSVGSTELHARNKLNKIQPAADIDTAPTKALEQKPKRAAPVNAPPPAKKAKAQNFLIAGAKKAKAARSARTAARVGVDNTKTNKLSNTGSGIPISKVVRLKYVKGFTQAVRTPCRMEDL